MEIVKPKRLQKGDTVEIISPSGAIRPRLQEQFYKGVATFESFGLKVKLGKHVFDQYYYSAGTRDVRIKDFNDVWRDPEVKMILMSQGGYTANQLLDSIDYEVIKNNPKIFAGISDGTTLLNAIFAKTGLVTYHGPDLLWTFGRKMTELFKQNFIKTFFDGNVGELFENKNWKHQERKDVRPMRWRSIRNGKATGILMGGHVECLSNIMLAGYAPNFTNSILFLEGTEDAAHLDAKFEVLRLNGVFEKINGLIIGWFEEHEIKEKDRNREVSDIILETTRDYSFPILEIGELGHNVENYVLPIGCKATIDADKKYFSIDEPTVL
ncbi:MAG: LD-carboxypeptidase [Candidatus Levybacteria bacterium]|nr:LD-carboxypeptidase [Candidatus Levybacteria bacterium]